jgi:hypothetical protein
METKTAQQLSFNSTVQWIQHLTFFTNILIKIKHFESQTHILFHSGMVRGYYVGGLDKVFVKWFGKIHAMADNITLKLHKKDGKRLARPYEH